MWSRPSKHTGHAVKSIGLIGAMEYFILFWFEIISIIRMRLWEFDYLACLVLKPGTVVTWKGSGTFPRFVQIGLNQYKMYIIIYLLYIYWHTLCETGNSLNLWRWILKCLWWKKKVKYENIVSRLSRNYFFHIIKYYLFEWILQIQQNPINMICPILDLQLRW